MTKELDAHRAFAVACFNRAWDLILKKKRKTKDDDEMLHCAHASRYHWGFVGKPVNLARGEWQCSRVYAVLGRPEPALHHARRCLEICAANSIGDFDIAYAHEALARACRVAKKPALRKRHLARAKTLGAAIAEKDDREMFFQDLATA